MCDHDPAAEPPSVRPTPPPADLPVDAARVRRLMGQCLPEAGVDLSRGTWDVGPEPLGEGWDNVLWPVGELDGQVVVARVVRRESAMVLLRREVTVLRHLRAKAPQLPMRVPTPLATAEAAVLMPWIPGTTAAEADAAKRADLARDVARMLAHLHSLPVPAMDRSTVRGVLLARRARSLADDLARADLTPRDRRRAIARWDQGIFAAPWSGEGRLLHGDPHPGNVVVAETSQATDVAASALIDWGDTTSGDPASDLGALLLHDPSDAVLGTYRAAADQRGSPEDEVWDALVDRAWAWGTRMAVSLVGAYPPDHPLGTAGHRLLRT